MNRSRQLFAVVAVFVVASLALGAVGTALADWFSSSKPPEDDVINNDELARPLIEQIEKNPNDAKTMVDLANLYAYSGKIEEAVDLFQRALSLEPNNYSMRLQFGRALANARMFLDAEVQYNIIIAAQPDNADAYFSRGELYENWEPPRIELAVADYRKVTELRPDSGITELARDRLVALGFATPELVVSPVASPEAGLP